MLRRNYLILLTSLALATQSIAQDNSSIPYTSLMVNGRPLDYTYFSISSRGVLGLVEGNPRSAKHKLVQFRVMLRRAGMLIRQWPASVPEGIYSVQLDEVWPFARFGDELVVEPTGNTTQSRTTNRDKQIIKLKAINWLTINWPKRDGC